MNAFVASECTSGCESGWTLYLEQSFLSPATTSPRMVDIRISGDFYGKKDRNVDGDEEEEEQEDDLSMLSDASSGPPHFNDDETYFNFDNNVSRGGGRGGGRNSCGGKRRKERKSRRRSEKQEAVDDTASSPALKSNNFVLPSNNPDYSQGFSATHFEGRSAYQAQFGYVQPSQSGNQIRNNQWY